MVSIQLLGGATLRRNDAPLAGPPTQRHRVALLALLAASWPRAVARDHAQALLWPEHDAAGSRRLLNLAVHVLRRALGDAAIVSTGDGLLFDPDVVRTDLHAFRSAAAAGQADVAARAWGGPLLAGFHLPGSAEFEHWLAGERAELGHTYERMLVELAARQESAGDVHACVATCRRLVAADPFSGPHVCLLMSALAAAGDVAGALRCAAEHARVLRAELGIDAGADVTALVRRLQEARRTEAAAVEAEHAAAVALPLVAVRDTDGGRDPLNVEVRDRFIERLLALRSIDVAALPGAGLRLGSLPSPDRPRVDALVETRASLSQDGVSIAVRMIDAERGVYLMSRRWESSLAATGHAGGVDTESALATLLDEAVDAVARAITARPRTAAATDAELEEARLLCARGQFFCAKREERALRRAVDCFDRALALAPDHAPAWTGLAGAYAVLGFYDLMPPREAFTLARQAAEKARALNPASAESHASLGYIAEYFEWDWGAAERELGDAIHLDPGYALGHQWLGNYLVLRGRFDDAVRSMERAVRLAPQSAIAAAATGWAEGFAGRYDRALERLAEAEELDAALPMAQLWRGQTLLEMGRLDDAVAALRRAHELSPTSAAAEASLAYAVARAGGHDEARDTLRRLAVRRGSEYVPSYEVAKVHLALGDAGRALHWLRSAVRERSHSIGFLRVDPQLAPLRHTSAFHRLLRSSGHD